MGQNRTNKIFLLLLLTGFVFIAPAAWATIYTVSKTADTNDGTCNADCSLREAILAANADSSTPHTINFNIPSATDAGCNAGTTICTIKPTSVLPTLTKQVTINGYSQPNAAVGTNNFPSAINSTIKIELDGTSAGNVIGITINVANVTIKGLSIINFRGSAGTHGISVTNTAGVTGTKVQGNFIGIKADGTTAAGNQGNGVIFNGTNNTGNLVGTDGDGANDAAERNLISGNTNDGVYINGSTIVAGNFIGTDKNGTTAKTNTLVGVRCNNAAPTIGTNGDGSNDAIEGNLISGNTSHGIRLQTGCGGTVIAGNYIGTTLSGNTALGNSQTGILIDSAVTTAVRIGTNSDGVSDTTERNIIGGNSGSNGYGIRIEGTNAKVMGNYIGLGADGATLIPNNKSGIYLYNTGNTNTIGTDGNGVNDSAEINTIAGNTEDGITIDSADTNTIAGNKIGLKANSTDGGNGRHGIYILNSSINNAIGGDIDIEANDVAYNGDAASEYGIYVSGAASDGNKILHNALHNNQNEGIKLDGAGANNDQAAPTILSQLENGTSLKITGTATINDTVQIFDADSDNQEGQTYIAQAPANGLGNWTISVGAPYNAINNVLVATTTNAVNGTSAFSTAYTVTNTTPLAFAQTVTGTQSTNSTITLAGTDGNGDPLTYQISTLPAHGSLYQTTNGTTLGAQITAVPTAVTDLSHRVIFVPVANDNGSSYGNFGFKVNDGNVDSTEATITVNITGLTITESGDATNLTEGLPATDTYTVVLTSQPTADVLVVLTPDTQVTVSPSTLTFTAANWNILQTVTVTAVDDNSVEGNHTSIITHAVTSTDLNFNSLNYSVTANVTDNDSAGVSITESGGSSSVTEGGATDSYTVFLTSQPTANVTIVATSNGQIQVSPATLTFTTINWNTPQTITITAVDDHTTEGTHAGAITHTSGSADSNYNGLAVNALTPSITDNDSAGVSISQTGGATSVVEGGDPDTYALTLTSQPQANVTLTLTYDLRQITTDVAQLVFTPFNWNVPQTVAVSGIDDGVVEGAHATTIAQTSGSSDTNYNALTIDGVTVSLSDPTATPVDEPTTNASPTVYAGADFQAIATTSAKLYGLASDADDDTLTYQWTQISGEAVILTDATQAEAHFNAPETVGDVLVFELDVSDGQATTSDTVAVTIINKTILVSEISYQNFTNKVIAADGKGHVVKMSRVNGETVLDLGDDYFLTMQSETPHALYLDGKIIIADPTYNNTSGIVALIDKSLLTDTNLDFDNTDFDLNAGVIVAHGSSPGDGFGYTVVIGDINGDDATDIFVLAPGTTNGTVYILDGESLEALHLIVGSADELLKSPFLAAIDFNGSDGAEALVGLGDSASLSRSATRDITNIVQDTSRSFNGLLSRSDFPTVVNFTDEQPDFVLNTHIETSDLIHGDVNNDGLDDAILASHTDARFAIIFGNSGIGTTQSVLDDSNVVLSDEVTDYTSIATGDVNGDGIDDIIIGYANANNGGGKILVHLGTDVWTVADYDPQNAVTLAGPNGSSIGQWLIVADANDDGVPDIYTNNGDDNSMVISLAHILGNSTATAASGNGLGPGGVISCVLNTAPGTQGSGSCAVIIFLIVAWGVWKRGHILERQEVTPFSPFLR